MLNNHHVFAQRIINDEERRVYKTHMCGLCHALGDEYGLVSRVVTNHDMILLNMLVTSQQEAETEIIERSCPLNPLAKVAANSDAGSKFSSAVAIELAQISALDNVQDSKGRDLQAKFAHKLLEKPHQTALKILRELGFDTLSLTELSASQTKVENDQTADPALPSARTSAALFSMTARLANAQQNQEILAKIGAHYGAYIYLKDALDDFLKDQHHNEFNPLKRFSKEINGKLILSLEGIEWLIARLNQISIAIATDIKQVRFYHNESTIVKLLNEPIVQTIANLEQGLANMGSGLVFKRLNFSDGLKAAAFMIPVTVALTTPQGSYQSCDAVNSNQLNSFVLAESCGETIGGWIGAACCVIFLCSKTGGLFVSKSGSGYSVRPETGMDCCMGEVCK